MLPGDEDRARQRRQVHRRGQHPGRSRGDALSQRGQDRRARRRRPLGSVAITAREVHGQGSASATSSVRIGQNGTGTQVALGTHVQLNGKVAGLGQSVIQSVSERLVGQFAQNLRATFTAEQQGANGSGRAASSALLGAVNGIAGTNRVGNDTPDEPGAASATTGGARAGDGAAGSDGASLDAGSLMVGVIGDQLKRPVVLVPTTALVTLLLSWLLRAALRRGGPRTSGIPYVGPPPFGCDPSQAWWGRGPISSGTTADQSVPRQPAV